MSNTIRTKISLRKDIASNWTNANPTLANGELAIVILDDGTENIKLGNGLSSFNELQYLYLNKLSSDSIYSNELHSSDVITKSIAQGINVKATPTSLATGVYAEADGNFDVVHGVEAKAKEGDDYAFVYNGNDLLEISQRYTSHGKGTFNINSLSGLSGIYLGERSVFDILHDYCEKQKVEPIFHDLSSGLSSKVYIGKYYDLNYHLSSSCLSVTVIDNEEYYKLVAEEKQNNEMLYVLSSHIINAYDKSIINVGEPISANHAATKNYVDINFCTPAQVSAIVEAMISKSLNIE